MQELEIEINGIITVPENMTQEQFWHEFILMIESKGWFFGGNIDEYTKEKDEEVWEEISPKQGKLVSTYKFGEFLHQEMDKYRGV